MATREEAFPVRLSSSRGHAARQDEEHAHATSRCEIEGFTVRGHGTRYLAPNTRHISVSLSPAVSPCLIAPMLLCVKVVPGSSRDRVSGRYADGIKVQVSAAPQRGKANAAVIAVLAEFFSVKPSNVELISGVGNPRKQFRISGRAETDLAAK